MGARDSHAPTLATVTRASNKNMKTKSGVLFLTKSEREALAIVLDHARRDHNYGVGGSFGDGEKFENKKEYRKALQGFEVIEFVLEITA